MMDWINRFSLFLFDFDGLLVNTEKLHFKAYKQICKERDVNLLWDFDVFCKKAHYSAGGVQSALLEEFPHLFENENWEQLYEAKKRAYQTYISGGEVTLMPGVEWLLKRLSEREILHCVVTHSPREQVETISSFLPLLMAIPHWFTREDYTYPKPNPDGYLTALRKLNAQKGRVIGFEDTFKGLQALKQAFIHPVVISSLFRPEKEVTYFESFEAIPSRGIPSTLQLF